MADNWFSAIEETVDLMAQRLESKQGSPQDAMCRLSFTMSKSLVMEVKKLQELLKKHNRDWSAVATRLESRWAELTAWLQHTQNEYNIHATEEILDKMKELEEEDARRTSDSRFDTASTA